STTVSAIAAARPASTALPPRASIERPACAARGCEVATTFFASTGMRCEGYEKSQVNIAIGEGQTPNGSIAEKGGSMTAEVAALVFDAYGTLFDVHSVAKRAEALFAGRGAAL